MVEDVELERPIQRDVRISCRFYEEKYPEKESVIVARVREIGEMGAYANLLEYNNIEGMILMSELSRRRIRSVNKLVRIGRDEYVLVLRADTEKGYIDLSKRRTSPEDHTLTENRYQKAKCVYSIVKHTSSMLKFQTDEELESLMERTVWYLNRKYHKERETAKASYEIFKKAVDDPSVLDECDITDEEKQILLRNIKLRMMPTPERIRADITVSCTGPDGVEAVKAALRAGIEAGKANAQNTENSQENGDGDDSINAISITLIAPPEYVVQTQSLDKEQGIDLVWSVLRAVEQKIKTFPFGISKIKSEPKVVGPQEDESLKAAMEQAEAANRQVDGDDAEDE